MGDMADWEVHNGYYEDWELDGPCRSFARECRYCGVGGLHWATTKEGKWRLVDEERIPHSCSEWKPSGAVLP